MYRLTIERECQESIRQLAIASAGSGWNGEAAKDLCERFESVIREVNHELTPMHGQSNPDPKPQIALSAEEFLRQIKHADD